MVIEFHKDLCSPSHDGAKMEAGVNPARSRHCNGGALFRTSLKPIDMPQIACRFGKAKSAKIPESGDMHSLNCTAVPEKRRRCKRSEYGLQFLSGRNGLQPFCILLFIRRGIVLYGGAPLSLFYDDDAGDCVLTDSPARRKCREAALHIFDVLRSKSGADEKATVEAAGYPGMLPCIKSRGCYK